VELGWFIARPVARELKAWFQQRDRLRWNRASRRTALLGGAVLVVLLWPWRTTVLAPAVLGALQSQALYAPYAAQVVGTLPRPGQPVQAGQPLLQLRSPELASRLAQAQAREQQLQWQLSQQPFDERLMEAGAALRKHWEAAAAEVAGLQDEMRRLTLTAPFDGTVAEADEDAPAGAWIPAGERLLQLVGPQGSKADAFVDEAALPAIAEGQHATFIPLAPEQPAVHCRVSRVDAVQLAHLDTPAVASPYGGGNPAQRAADGRLLPLQPTFHVRLEHCDRTLPPRSEQPGTARLQGERQSLAEQAWRWLVALWQRESTL